MRMVGEWSARGDADVELSGDKPRFADRGSANLGVPFVPLESAMAGHSGPPFFNQTGDTHSSQSRIPDLMRQPGICGM